MEISQTNGLIVLFSTVIGFYVLNRLVAVFGAPAVIRQKGKEEVWKWKNLLISLFHASLIGSWDLLCFYIYPELMDDLIFHINPFTFYMVIVSSGYFVYDSLDMLLHGKVFIMWELTVHHFTVGSMFMYNAFSMRCVGYNVVALLAEVNSVFLHSRKLLQMLHVPFDTRRYRCVALVNIVTFALFRGLSVARILYGMCTEYERVDRVYFVCLSVSMFIMFFLNLVLFWILLKNDFLRKKRPTSHQSNGGGGEVDFVEKWHSVVQQQEGQEQEDNNNHIRLPKEKQAERDGIVRRGPPRRSIPDVLIPDLNIDEHKIE